MSDDLPTTLVTHGGWIATIAVTIWGAILRTMLGRHYKAIDKVDKRLENIESDVASIDTRISIMEGRFIERNRHRTGGYDE